MVKANLGTKVAANLLIFPYPCASWWSMGHRVDNYSYHHYHDVTFCFLTTSLLSLFKQLLVQKLLSHLVAIKWQSRYQNTIALMRKYIQRD